MLLEKSVNRILKVTVGQGAKRKTRCFQELLTKSRLFATNSGVGNEPGGPDPGASKEKVRMTEGFR